jgi:pSer/pThr/pTyr-binding forkhead associated (FHA) protein
MSEQNSDKRTSLPVLIPLGLHAKNQPIKLGRPVYVLGSKQQCRIHLVSSSVSNTHAVLVQTRHITYIRDLCSRTHVYVNGDEVTEAVLHDGDLLTIGRFQFKYQGPIKDHGAEPACLPAVMNVVGSDTPVPLENRAIVIGRRPTCDVPLLEESVSTIHAVILQWEGQRFLRDLWSRTGTFVNGKAIHECELKPGDHIKIGETEMTYAPSVDEVAFSLVEGASDSIYADTPAAEEVDLGKEIEPKVTAAQAPLELILTPKSPPPPEELLPLDADETIEPTAHDTAHIPLSIEVESTGSKTATPTSGPLGSGVIPQESKQTPELSARGWKSSSQGEPALEEEPTLELEPIDEVEVTGAPAGGAKGAREVIEPTQPTPESAQALPMEDLATPQPAPASAELTDTTFGLNVEEFEGVGLGPIVESPEPVISQVVPSAPISIPPSEPNIEEMEPTLSFPVEPAENLAVIDSSAIPVDHSLEPLLEVTPRGETPSLASLAEDVVHPVAEEEPTGEFCTDENSTGENSASEISTGEIPVLSDSIVPETDSEPEIDLSPMPEQGSEPAIDDTLGEQPAVEGPLLSAKEQTIDLLSTDDEVEEQVDSLEPVSGESVSGESVSGPISVNVESVAGAPVMQEIEEIEPVAKSEAVSIPREVTAVKIAEPHAVEEPILLTDEDEIKPEESVEPAATPEPIETAAETEEVSISSGDVPEAMEDAPIAVTSDEVEEVSPPVHAESVEEMETPAIALQPSDVTRLADESFEPVEAATTDSLSLVSDESDSTPAMVSANDTAAPMLPVMENEPVLESAKAVDEPAIELSPSDETPIEVEETVDVPNVAVSEAPVNAPVDESAVLDFLTGDEPAVESPTLLSDSVVGQATTDHTADAPPVETVTSSEERAFNIETPEEIPSSPTLESAMANAEPQVDLAKLSPVDQVEEAAFNVEASEEIPSAPALESAVAGSDEKVDLIKLSPMEEAGERVEEPALDIETPEEIPSAPALESVMGGGGQTVDLERLTPADEVQEISVDEPALGIETPEEIPSAPTLESAMGGGGLTVDLEKLTPADEVQVTSVEEPALSIETPEEIPSSPTLESAMAGHETKVKLEKLTAADQVHEPIEEPVLSMDVPEGIPSAPTLESAMAGGEPKVELEKLTPADQVGESVEEPAAIDDTLTSTAPILETNVHVDVAAIPVPVPEAPPMSAEPADLSSMGTKDESVAPVDESAALDFLTSSEPSHEGQATIDESSIEVPPAVSFPDINPPVVPADEKDVKPVSIPPIEDQKIENIAPVPLMESPVAPLMDAPVVEPPADLGFKAIPIPRVAKRGRRGAKPRVIRDGFHKGDGASQPGQVEIPPFMEHAAGVAAGESLQGLSQPPVRQTDVFSEMPGAAAEVRKDIFSAASPSEADRFAHEVAKLNADDEFIGKAVAAKRPPEIVEKAPRPGGRGVIQPGFDFAAAPKPVVRVLDPDAAIVRRRKLLRRVPVLMTVMLLLIGAAWAAAFFFTPLRTRIQATLVFHDFNHKTQREQHLFEADQANRLGQDITRRTAIRMLQNRYPGITPGFLENADQYGTIATNPETHWMDDREHLGQFVMRYDGSEPIDDRARMEAVALAMYDSNSQMADDAHSLKTTLAKLSTDIDAANSRIDEIRQQQDHERAIIDGKPTKDQLDKLKADDADYNAEYNIAVSKLKDAQADLNRMLKQQSEPTTAPADLAASDDELQKMSKDADALSGQIEEARKERAATATKARETLDAAYDDFKKQVEAAQGATKDNPELAAYVTAAQNTQQAIRDLTDQYIQHQQDEYAELNGFKEKMVANMQAHKADVMANDPKLKDLNDQKEIVTRKLNTAKGQGLDKDAADFQAQLELLDTAIKAQQEIVSNDPVYNEMITGLQKLIDQKSHTIDAERRKIDERLAELKSSFNKSAPAVEKLPAEQKELASAMQDRLSQLDAARRQYAEAANTSAADADSSVKSLKEQLQTIQTNIEVRKKQILASANKPSQQDLAAAIAQQQALVKQLEAARNTARETFENNQTNLQKENAIEKEAEAASQRLEDSIVKLDQVQKLLDQNKAEWDQKNAEANSTVEPVEPTPDSVVMLGDPVKERRNAIVTYGGFSSLGIFVVFAGWIMLTLLGAAREAHEAHIPAIEALETPGPHGNIVADDGSEAEENEAAVA